MELDAIHSRYDNIFKVGAAGCLKEKWKGRKKKFKKKKLKAKALIGCTAWHNQS
jgi:hypothetical protein